MVTATPCGKDECVLPSQFVVSPANNPDAVTYHVCSHDLAEGIRLMVDQDAEGIVLVCLEGDEEDED